MKKSDDTLKNKQQIKIDVTNQDEMQKWCSELQCNEMRLKNAVRAVGSSADAVRRYMSKKF